MNKISTIIKKTIWNIVYWRNPVKLARKMGVMVGDHCRIMRGNKWGSEPYLIEIGSHVLISGGCNFVTHDGCVNTVRGITGNNNLQIFGRILIKDNASIGTSCIIMPGVTIGKDSVIGAGSLVIKSVPDGEVWAGVPAKFIQTTDEYVNKVLLKATKIDPDAYKWNKQQELQTKVPKLQ